MQLIHEVKEDVIIVKPLEKRMDAAIVVDFKKLIEGFVKEGQVLFILDLSAVDFIDSSGIITIVACLRMLEGRGNLVIAGAREKVIKLFKLTRMDQIFQIFSNSEEAFAAFS